MRLARREWTDKESLQRFVEVSAVGRLGTMCLDGPMIKPVNYVMIGDALYFHGSSQGEKMDDIRRDPRVVFEIDEEAGYVRPNDPETPCKASFHFRSAIIRGRGVIVEDETERVKALNGLMQKYQPDGAYDPVTSGMAAGTAVVRIDIESLTGKIAL